MSDEMRNGGVGGDALGVTEDEAVVGRLITEAGKRPDLPAEELAWARQAVRAAWDARPASPSVTVPAPSRRGALAAALAAGVAAVIGLAWWLATDHPHPGVMLASVIAIKGDARTAGPEGDSRPLAVGQSLSGGVELRTAPARGGRPGFVAVRLASGGTLRLDAGSRVRLLGPQDVGLVEGALYVDSGVDERAAPVVVRTPLGDVRELGTQFTVRLAPGARELRVRVREGVVATTAGGERRTARAGQELVVDQRGRTALRQAGASGPDWAWVIESAPRFSGEGHTVRELLTWVSRETGWRLRFEAEAEREAAAAVLHGAAAALPPDRAAFALLPGAGLEAELRDGTLVVRSAR
ncbi:MAG TPA: FecR domain-containing protein [Thermoanaerobaculia bacterium]|nr:FecR domain-containing protein [Thermoanaerobaculia bacterium]